MFKMGIFLVFFLVIFSLLAWLTNYNKVKIEDFTVSGNISVSKDQILGLVKKEASKKYIFLFAKDNLLFLPRSNIENLLLDEFKKIERVEITFSGLRSVNVNILERIAVAMWCKGLPENSDTCFFVDSLGYIFSEAPVLSGDLFPKYFGLVTKDNPIGETFLNPEVFGQISKFFYGVKSLGLDPIGLLTLDEHEYEIYLSDGGKINFNDKKTFSNSLDEMNALIVNNLIKTDKSSLTKINHIDLRYNKIHYDFR